MTEPVRAWCGIMPNGMMAAYSIAEDDEQSWAAITDHMGWTRRLLKSVGWRVVPVEIVEVKDAG